jgi:hypothetical protein
VAYFLLDVKLALGPLLTIITATGASNVFFAAWLRVAPVTQLGDPENQRERYVLVAVMTADLVALTSLLYFSGVRPIPSLSSSL